MAGAVRNYLSSFAEDRLLADIDIDVGEAHALTLARAGIFARAETRRVLAAFERTRRRWRGPGAAARAEASGFHDIHPLVERDVMAACGEAVGGRIHLGKSRNDQVAADVAIFARRGLLDAAGAAAALHAALLRRTAGPVTVLPAFTHARPAQSTTLAHWALAHAAAVHRDAERLLAARARLNRSPLGAAAVAGTSVPLDRAFTARLLGFDGVWEHALDATSARDHLLEAQAAIAIHLANLSRLAA